jgi:DNA-binding CsgD family transcriptional regulator
MEDLLYRKAAVRALCHDAESLIDHPSELVDTVLSRLAECIDADVVGLNAVDLAGTLHIETFPVTAYPRAAEIELRRVILDHPLVSHYAVNRVLVARTVSDVVSDRQFRSSSIYRAFFGPVGVNCQLVIPLGFPALDGEVTMVGLVLNRSRLDFQRAERERAELLTAVLGSIWRHAGAIDRMRTLAAGLLAGVAPPAATAVIETVDGGTVAALGGLAELIRQDLGLDIEVGGRLPLPLIALLQRASRCSRHWRAARVVRDELVTATGTASVTAVAGPHGAVGRHVLVRLGQNRPEGLTPRQRQVLALVSEGRSNRQIARELAIAPRTVDEHIEAILQRLDVANRTAAARRHLLDRA